MSNKRWGCPWHGLVEDGGLQTPAGRLYIGYPSHGDTHLIDFGMPAVDTPAEHQAKGMSWLNKAIISGGRLHGKQLPPGSWIWRDDNDENWLVQTDLHRSSQSSPTRSVTLTRFGVLGGAPIQHSYSVAGPDFVSDILAAYPDEPSPGFTCFMFSAHPTGKEAVFRVGSGNESYHQPTSSWLLVELSGTGGNCNVSISILRTAMQTKGAAVHVGPADFGVSVEEGYAVTTKGPSLEYRIQHDDRGDPPECGGTLIREVDFTLVPDYHRDYSVGYQELNYQGEIVDELSGVIIGMIHDADGNIQEVKATLTRLVTASTPEPTFSLVNPTREHTSYYNEVFDRCDLSTGTLTEGSIRKQLTQSVKFESTVSISVNGDVEIEDSHRYEWTMSEDATVYYMMKEHGGDIYSLGYDVSHAYTIKINDEVYSHTYLDDDADGGGSNKLSAFTTIPDLRNLSKLSNSEMKIDMPRLTPEDLFIGTGDYLQRILSISNAAATKTTLAPHVFANGVYGIRRQEGGTAQHADKVVTPAGVISVDEGEYASYNPITGQVARSRNRVNWI